MATEFDFEQAFRDGFPKVYRICLAKFGNRDFAQEITQEAFVRAYAKLWQLKDKSKFIPWVTAIAFHFGYNKYQQDSQRYNSLPDDHMLERGYISSLPPGPRLYGESFFTRWIKTLKKPDHRLFVLRYYYRMSMLEISEKTGRPLGTVKRRLAHLKIKLREAMERERQEDT